MKKYGTTERIHSFVFVLFMMLMALSALPVVSQTSSVYGPLNLPNTWHNPLGSPAAVQTFQDGVIFGNITGIAHQCLHVDTTGAVTGTGSDCGAGGGGVTSIFSPPRSGVVLAGANDYASVDNVTVEDTQNNGLFADTANQTLRLFGNDQIIMLGGGGTQLALGGGFSNPTAHIYTIFDGQTGSCASGGCISANGQDLTLYFNTVTEPLPTWPSQTQDLVWASPCGSSGLPSFRALCATDLTGLILTGTGTTGKLSEWTSSTALGDSPIHDLGSQGSYGELTVSDGAAPEAFQMDYGIFATPGSGYTLNNGPNHDAAIYANRAWKNNCGGTNAFCYTTRIQSISFLTAGSTSNELAGLIVESIDDSSETAATSLGTLTGVRANAESTTLNTSTLGNMFGIFATAGCTGIGHPLVPTDCANGVSISQTVTKQFAGAFLSNGIATTLTTNGGIDIQTAVGSNSGVIANNYGILVETPVIRATGTLQHNYGLYIQDQTSAGSGTNTEPHGIYVAKGGIQHAPTTRASLPSCSAAYDGTIWPVTDSDTVTWGDTVVHTTGTSHVLAYCDGTNWTVAAK